MICLINFQFLFPGYKAGKQSLFSDMLLFKKILFSAIIFLLILLAGATVASKIYGQEFIETTIYSSPFFIAVWFVVALLSSFYIKHRRLHKRQMIFMIHFSFAVILFGALVTWKTAVRGTLIIEKGITVNEFYTDNEKPETLPFSVTLESFDIEKYPGTNSPSDYISKIIIQDNDKFAEGKISMNNIFSYKDYRFYQGGYDDKSGLVCLLVSYDPFGIFLTYLGYLTFIVVFLLFFFSSKSHFRQLLKSPVLRNGNEPAGSDKENPHGVEPGKSPEILKSPVFSSVLKKSVLLLLLFAASPFSYASEAPKVLSREQAAEFCEITVLYNGRIMPLETFARDFTIKIYGKAGYNGYTPEQVMTGWMFYYQSWKKQPVIKIKGGEVKKHLGITGNYASYNDYISSLNEYKLSSVSNLLTKRDFAAADEKFNLIKSLCSGHLLKMFPHIDSVDSSLCWYSAADMLPSDISDEKWYFIKKSMDYVHESVIMKDFTTYSGIVEKIKKYQRKEVGSAFPSETMIGTEKLYNKFSSLFPLGIILFAGGVLFLIYYYKKIHKKSSIKGFMYLLMLKMVALSFTFLTFVICLRWYISGHIPVSNGFETMLFLAWSVLLTGLIFLRRMPLITISGFILSGLVIIVASISNKSPQITPLMPVLSSPLLCIHVVLVMLAYTLLAFIMMNGVMGMIISSVKHDGNGELHSRKLFVISNILLYPAILLLSAGIIVGAVWANISWGRYWGWDPKEVWALITLFIYSFALHGESIKSFREPLFFHRFSVVAFLSVAMTYWGVNYLLGGLHSYAG